MVSFFAKKHVFLTGCTGFIAKWCALFLLCLCVSSLFLTPNETKSVCWRSCCVNCVTMSDTST
jgi:hypothetical protein